MSFDIADVVRDVVNTPCGGLCFSQNLTGPLVPHFRNGNYESDLSRAGASLRQFQFGRYRDGPR